MLLGCQPGPGDGTLVTCPPTPVPEGEVHVGEVVCSEQLFTGGDGRAADLWLANSRFRAVLRHPEASLTLAGVGGGTLVDAAAWGRADVLHEVAPLVDGGWLRVEAWEVQEDGVLLRGRVARLPDRPTASEGAEAEVAWRVRPDDPWLHLEGADGLWIHPDDDLDLLDGWLVGPRAVVGHDGAVEDLGGALRVSDATRLLLADAADAWGERPGAQQVVSGEAPDADEILLLRGEDLVGRLPVQDGRYEATVPAEVDGLVSTASGRARGPRTAPGEGVDLVVGDAGEIGLRLAWEAPLLARSARVSWTADDGREGTTRVASVGEVLRLGAGVLELVVSAGPGVQARRVRVEVPPDEQLELGVQLSPSLDPGAHVLAAPALLGSRDRSVREDARDLTALAAADGVAWASFVARDDVEDGAAWVNDLPWITWTDGVTLTHPEGWSVTAWPWGSSPRRSGHGAPVVRDEDPLEALNVAWGGSGNDRTLLVDLPWMTALEVPPALVGPIPDFVRLVPPGAPPFERWAPWFAWLDAGRFVRPTGERVWLEVGAPGRFGAAELERALNYGRICATTGALIELAVDGRGPGSVPEDDTGLPDLSDGWDLVSTAPGPAEVRFVVQAGSTAIDRATVVSDGEEVVTLDVVDGERRYANTLDLGAWTTVVAWSTTTGDWAVVTPVWRVRPEGVPEDERVLPPPADAGSATLTAR